MDEKHMQHGRDWSGEDVAGWLASEKLDGVRAYWDGEVMWGRSGRIIPVPAGLARQLPPCPLDGELWAGRGGRGPVLSALRGRWSPAVRFMVFDRPGLDLPWAGRLAAARAALRGDFASVVEATPVTSSSHLRALYLHVRSLGGEGLMLMHPGVSHYHRFRVGHLLKLKRDPAPFWRRLLGALAA
jgi:DNA ligase-1